eukprot:COSAG05_NODE_662_length_8034_cov_10.368998_7_plen_53_part_00
MKDDVSERVRYKDCKDEADFQPAAFFDLCVTDQIDSADDQCERVYDVPTSRW